MPQNPAKLVVVGHGAAGLAAALAAAEQAQGSGLPVDITVLEKAREAQREALQAELAPGQLRTGTVSLPAVSRGLIARA